MQLWTIQPMEVLQDLEQQGVLTADPEKGDGKHYAAAYAWMRGQMTKRVPKYSGGPLWWAYSTKPDLRNRRHQMLPYAYVRLELDVPQAELLLSDLDAWIYVLNDWYIPVNEEDSDRFDARMEAITGKYAGCPPELRSELERSWERIFTPEILTEYTSSKPPFLQATFEWLRLSDVRHRTYFFGNYKPRFYGPNAIGPDDLPPIEGFGDPIRIRDKFLVQSIDNKTGNTWDEGVNILCGYERQNDSYKVYVLNEDGSASCFSLGGKKYPFTRRCTRVS